MPSPSIPRSRSVPKISTNPSISPSSSDVLPAPSIQSLHSDNSPRTYWPKKLNRFLLQRKSSTSSLSNNNNKNQKLTEESLKEFNRLNEIFLEDKRYLSYSPYYRGLTDSSLAINNPQRSPFQIPIPIPAAAAEHDTESHAATFYTSSSKSSIVLRMQEWGTSCFLSGSKDKEDRSSTTTTTSTSARNTRRTSPNIPTTASTSSSSSRRKTVNMASETSKKSLKQPINEDTEIRNIGKHTSDVSFTLLYTGKPLRERISNQQSQPPSPPSTPPHPPLKKVAYQSVSQQSIQPHSAQPPEETTSSKISETLASQTQPTDNNSGVPVKESTMESDVKYFWAHRYRPFSLKDFVCNRSTALQLQSLAIPGNCGHFIFEGPPGVGKRTMIWALLRESFGPDKVQAREECKKFILKGEAVSSITVNIKQSPQLVEVNLSELKGYEKHIIVELIKERYNKSNKECKECRAIILYEADKLPTEALVYIRWILERYQGGNKVFFCCSDASKIRPLESLCNIVKLLPPSTEEIIEVLELIAKEEGIRLPHKLAEKIAKNSKNNLRQAIRSFEATWHFNSSLQEDQEILTGWEDDIANIARSIIEEQSPKQLYNIRGKLQNLIEHNVSPEFIFETLIKELKKKLDGQLQKQIENLYEKYNRNEDSERPYSQARSQQEEQGRRLQDPVRKTVQQFMRIEEFIAKFMSWYKASVIKKEKQACSL